MAKQGFSIAATLLSYFLVAGGIALALILLVKAELSGEAAFYAAVGLGGAIGGAIAARASRGATILEPAIGGALVIATLVLMFVGSDVGTVLWTMAKDDIVRVVGIAGACAAAGAILGAMAGERLPGSHSVSRISWFFHAACSMLGACFVVFVILIGVAMRDPATLEDAARRDSVEATSDSDSAKERTNKLVGIMFGAMAVGALLTGLAVGASAPRRILLPSFLGGLVGISAFFVLATTVAGNRGDGEGGDLAAGVAIIGIVAGVIAMIGAAIGWRVVGRRRAQDAEATARAFA